MPYLKITSLPLEPHTKETMAQTLTSVINVLFFNPRGGPTRDELTERTTIHFVPYQPDEFYVGGKTPLQRGCQEVTAELSDWSMSVKQQRKVAKELTPVLADLFHIGADQFHSVNIRFHSYPPTAFAVGGYLLSDLVPLVGKLAKRLLG